MTRNVLAALPRFAAAALIALLATALAGCSLLGSNKLQTLTETAGMFHLQAPAEWAARSEQGLIVATDSETLPSDVEAIDTFWLLVYPSMDTTDLPVAEYLPVLVEARAAERAWQESDYGAVVETEIGGRPAVMMMASGKDSAGTEFEGRYYLVRTSGRDVIVAAIAPAGQLTDYAEELDTILGEQWYWHQPADSSEEPTSTDVSE